jgi:NADH-quinone oxidoreductase subunit G
MPHFFIDGQRIEAPQGKTIIEAAYENGLQIPHFCWHPDLSVAGNCRMCLVEVGMPKKNRDGSFELDEDGNKVINFIPKLQIACATPISEGMVVKSKSDKAVEAQEAVMEFLLINHPLDCPICDEAGECKLQEYAFTHSQAKSRFQEVKNPKDKRVRWGPNVMFDAERCISCSRCIRYAKEVAHQDVLTFVNRGDHVTIKLSEGTEWDNPYSMNVIEICPVGALTSPDFRFKSRVWEMSFNDSISFADSTGSNIKIGVRKNEILRIEPRTNMYVNKYWLSDDARLNHYKFVNENRITEPLIKNDKSHQAVDWDEAITSVVDELNKFKPHEIMILASPKSTTECNFIVNKFGRQILNTSNIDFLPQIDKTKEDDFLGVVDRAPNTIGTQEVGIKEELADLKAKDLVDNIRTGKIKALWIIEEDFRMHSHMIEALDELDFLIVQYYNHNKISQKADIVLPAATYAEIEGTYINKDKRVQHFTPALVTKENRRRMGLKMSRLDTFGADNDRWSQHELRDCKQTWRIVSEVAKKMGAKWNYINSEDVFEEIVKNVSSFKDMDYSKLDEYQGLVLNKGNKPDPKIKDYDSHVMKPN